ncbi:thiamine/thiamine pyrophosphate ABC transporter, permease protein, partial [Vibrio parahaemolyticus EKP-021]
MRLRSALCLQ